MEQGKSFRAIRKHKKSRLGCFDCKRRRVKCDEGQPACGACKKRREPCRYPDDGLSAPDSQDSQDSQAIVAARSSSTPVLVAQPSPRLPATSHADMRMLWFFTTYTSLACLPPQLDTRGFGATMQGAVVKEALDCPFLMKTLLALAGLHMHRLGQDDRVGRTTVLQYRTEALRGYREALGAVESTIVPALLPNSLLLFALTTDSFCDELVHDLYILDWMALSRGSKYVINMFHRLAANSPGGVSNLLIRPRLDSIDSLDSSVVPACLTRMVAEISSDDEDYAILAVYKEVLRLLGALYCSLREETPGTTALRIISWATLPPDEFLKLARYRRPRALVMLGHFGAFLKLLNSVWWLQGAGARCIRDVATCLETGWRVEMETPLLVSMAEEQDEMKRILLAAVPIQVEI